MSPNIDKPPTGLGFGRRVSSGFVYHTLSRTAESNIVVFDVASLLPAFS